MNNGLQFLRKTNRKINIGEEISINYEKSEVINVLFIIERSTNYIEFRSNTRIKKVKSTFEKDLNILINHLNSKEIECIN